MKQTILISALLAFLLTPFNDGFAQARSVMSGDSSILGICNDQLMLTGRLGPVSNGIIKYDGRRATVAANFARSGRTPADPWGYYRPIPAVPGIAPVLFSLGGGKEALGTTCGSLATTKLVLQDFYGGGLSYNYLISEGKLIVSRVNSRSIDLFSVVDGKATLLGSVPTMRQNPRNRPVGGEVYNSAQGFVLRALLPDTKQPLLWKLTSGGFQLISAFPDLVAEGYTFIRVLKFDTYQIAGGSLVIKVSARSAAGQEESFLYVTDGGDVRRVTESLNYVLPLQDTEGFIGIFQDLAGGGDTYGCKIGVFRAPEFEMEDVTPQGGLVPGDDAWCLNIFPRVTTDASLLFTHRTSSQTLRRFNVNTGAVTTVFAADARFEGSLYSLYGRVFFNLYRAAGEYGKTELYVSDGTPEGTMPIMAGNRILLGADPQRTIMYKEEMYTWAYTRLDARTGATQGGGLYRFPIPVGEVVE